MSQAESAAFGGHQSVSHHHDATSGGLFQGASLAFVLLTLLFVLEALGVVIWGLPVLTLVAVVEVPIMMVVVLVITRQ